MSLATALWNVWWTLLDELDTSVHVATYTEGDTVTYVLSDDQTHVRLTVQHVDQPLAEGAIASIIAPNLVKQLTESTQVQNEEKNIEESTREEDALWRGREELGKMHAHIAEHMFERECRRVDNLVSEK